MKMEDLVVSAPGKVILHGEHAVVYGKVAIAASLNLRTYLQFKKRKDNKINLNLPNININMSWTTDDIKTGLALPLCDRTKPEAASEEVLTKIRKLAGVAQDESDTKKLSLVVFLYLYSSIAVEDGCVPSADITVTSRQPVSAGLGSSAAYSVCLASSLLQHSGAISRPTQGGRWSESDLGLINSWAFFGEKILHGKPSGIDNSVSTYGGAISFQAGKITPLDSFPKLNILLVNTGVPRSTKVLVAKCRDKFTKYTDVIQPVLDSIEAISQRCVGLFAKMSEESSTDVYSELEDMIDINQHHLNILGVGHPALDNVVRVARQHNLHAKLTGAGGGGCAFALIRPDIKLEDIVALKSEFESQGLKCWETSIGSPGVIYHTRNDQNGIVQELFL